MDFTEEYDIDEKLWKPLLVHNSGETVYGIVHPYHKENIPFRENS